jgi:hypothetical protein
VRTALTPGAKNPFEYGRELGPGELADREEEIAEVRRTLLEGGKHFLIGPRRYGKSSIHNVAASEAREAGAAVLRYNVQGYPQLQVLAAAIVADTGRIVRRPIDQATALVGRLFRALRPTITVNPGDQTFSVHLGVADTTPPVPLLAAVLNGLEEAAAESGRSVGLVLDEFQQVVAPDGAAAEAQVRAAVQEHRRVGYVFAGSDTRMLAAMTGDSSRPFYRLGSVRFLDAVPRPAFLAFLRRGFELLGPVDDDALVAILDEAEDVPYNVQLLAHQCWTWLRERGEAERLAPWHVSAIHAEAARRLDPVYSDTWLGLTAPQRTALQVAIARHGEGLYSADASRQSGLNASSMQKAVDALIDKRVMWREARGGESRLRLEDPLFGVWVRHFTATP